jgi:predicted DNA-binding transcriptional regulator AlpA
MKRQYLTDIDLAERYSVSRTTVWRWTSKGRFPRPIRLGGATTRWSFDDVLKHEGRLHDHETAQPTAADK